jgi:glycosyltransferase involved in cell wall biosynthesis
VLEAAAVLPHVRFVLAGDGPERRVLQHSAEARNLANVVFTGYLDRDQVAEVYRTSHVLLCHLKDNPTITRTALPSKLPEYMAAGKPIIHGGRGLASRHVETIESGVAIGPDDPTALVAAISRLLGDHEEAARLGANGRAWAVTAAGSESPFASFVTRLHRRLQGRPGGPPRATA